VRFAARRFVLDCSAAPGLPTSRRPISDDRWRDVIPAVKGPVKTIRLLADTVRLTQAASCTTRLAWATGSIGIEQTRMPDIPSGLRQLVSRLGGTDQAIGRASAAWTALVDPLSDKTCAPPSTSGRSVRTNCRSAIPGLADPAPHAITKE